MEYLESGFNPKKLKVPELRRILAANDVEFPSKCKKTQLVNLFESEIVPKLPELRKKYLNVKKNDEGIQVITKKISKKNLKRQRNENESDIEEDADTKATKSTKDEESRESKKTKINVTNDEEITNKEVIQKREEKTDIKYQSIPQDSKVISQLPAKQQVSSPKRRRNIPLDLQKLQQKEKDSVEKAKSELKKNTTIESSQNSADKEIGSPIKPTLENEEVQDINDVKQTKKVENATKKSCNLRKLLLSFTCFISILLTIVVALWYREVRINVGYCGKELSYPPLISNTWSDKMLSSSLLKNYDIKSKLIDVIIPDCIPCPKHAVCYPLMKSACLKGYIPSSDLYNLYGLLPLPKTCLKDTTEDKYIGKIVEALTHQLRLKNSRANCGLGNNNKENGLTEKMLLESFSNDKSWLNEKQRQKIWRKAIVQLKKKPEIQFVNLHKRDPNQVHDDTKKYVLDQVERMSFNLFRSTSRQYVPFYCGMNFDILTSNNYKSLILLLVSLSLLTLLTVASKVISAHQVAQGKITIHVETIIESLKQNKQNNQEQSFLTTNQLKELIFNNGSEDNQDQNKTWQKILHMLERDDVPVTSTQLEIDGEIMRCYEYIQSDENNSK